MAAARGTRVQLVLLTGPLAPPDGVRRLAGSLRRLGPVLAPAVIGDADPPADLERAASAVLAASAAASTEPVVLCGVGHGALVALQVAASSPHRVRALALSSAAPTLSPAVRSVRGSANGLLPARVLQAMGRRGVLAALESVRAVDYRTLAPGVTAPAVLVAGADDPANLRTAQGLARLLPNGSSVVVPGAGPGWIWADPERWVAAVEPFLLGLGQP